MEDEEQVQDTSEPEVVEVVEDEAEAPEVDYDAELKKAKELAENYKIRAEKAERKAKETAPTVGNSLSAADLLALSKADIDPDDLDEVLDYAKYKNVSIADALKSTVVKATLAEKQEYRKSASAVNTGVVRRPGTQASDDKLLTDARNGIMPSSEADMERLIKLRLKR